MEIGAIKKHGIVKNELVFTTTDAIAGISFIGSTIVRIRIMPGAELQSEETFVVEHVPSTIPFSVADSKDNIILQSGALTVTIKKNNAAIRLEKNGKPVVATPDNGCADINGQTTTVRFVLTSDEKIFGLGQDPMANFDQRNKERRMWHEWSNRGNAGSPFFISNKGYALLLNSSWASRFCFGTSQLAEFDKDVPVLAPPPWERNEHSGENNPDQMAVILDNGIMDLFIIFEDSVDVIMENYSKLAGHAPMVPKWALGYVQCKCRYLDQKELLYIASEYRKRNISCDVLVLDWYWFIKNYGDLEWNREDWPDPKTMTDDLLKKGFKVMQAQHPYVAKESIKYEKFKKNGYLNSYNGPDTSVPPSFDHSNPDARKAWWHEIRRLYNDGIRGFWTDMGELETHPEGMRHAGGPRERIHNIYSLLWAKGLYEGQRSETNERVYLLQRTMYPGIQRYGSTMWSGDIVSTWKVLSEQVVIGQSVSLSGQPFWTTDIGGFLQQNEDNYSELYIRWFQWGTFCPLFRSHGCRPFNEVWSYGNDAEKIIKEFIELRYRLMPYIYSCARMVHEKGTPIMRAMVVDFPDDPVAVEQTSQYMFGPSILVAPVTTKNMRSRKVYLPQGNWYDFWTNKKYVGAQWIEADAPLHRMPLFVREGSIIPMSEVFHYVDEKPVGAIQLHMYAGMGGTCVVYDDDGLTYGYEKGAYAKTLITADASGKIATQVIEGDVHVIPENRTYTTIVHSGYIGNAGNPFNLYVTTSLSNSGLCSIDAFVTNTSDRSLSVKATVNPPQFWKITPLPNSQAEINSCTMQMSAHTTYNFHWNLVPDAELLPLEFKGSVRCEITCGDQVFEECKEVVFGSGYATRWSIIDSITGIDRDKGIDIPFPIEDDCNRNEYCINDTAYHWQRQIANEFNCFGYVNFCSTNIAWDKGFRGVDYAKCRIWSDEDMDAYIDLCAERNVKIWFNGSLVFSSPKAVSYHIEKKPITVKKGWNTILLKAALTTKPGAGGREFGFRFRLVDKQENLIEKLLYRPC